MDSPAVAIAFVAVAVSFLTFVGTMIATKRGADRDWVESIQDRLRDCEREQKDWARERIEKDLTIAELTRQLLDLRARPASGGG